MYACANMGTTTHAGLSHWTANLIRLCICFAALLSVYVQSVVIELDFTKNEYSAWGVLL